MDFELLPSGMESQGRPAIHGIVAQGWQQPEQGNAGDDIEPAPAPQGAALRCGEKVKQQAEARDCKAEMGQ